MRHINFIGKKLVEFYEATPEFAKKFYLIMANGNVKRFEEIIDDKDIMNKVIKNISVLRSNNIYYVEVD